MARANAEECLRCGGAMQEGFLVDRTQNFHHQLRWAPGPPNHGFFGVRLGGRDPLPVEARRCSRCGWLDLYAPDRPGGA